MCNEYLICPKCGCKLIKVRTSNSECSLCTDSTCRTMIKNDIISEMDMDIYSRLQQRLGFKKAKESKGFKAYMLLKEDLSGPLLVKNTNKTLSRAKTAFCIVKANSMDDAIKQFKERFEIIHITNDNVVEDNIVEDDSWT